MIKNLLFVALTTVASFSLHAQCTEWADPSMPDVYLGFGDVPCGGESREITSYEVNKSEAYLLGGIHEGESFTFSICNGDGAGSWVPDFTVLTPSGEVDAFGAGDGDACSITWTATETGDYTIVINEAGNCGVGGAVDNGYPKITTNTGGLPCPQLLEGAEGFEVDSVGMLACWQTIDADGDGSNWEIEEGDGFDGSNAIGSFSYTSATDGLTPDNYLITPQLALGDNDSLYYLVSTYSSKYSEEEYTVLVSTTGSEVADFTDEVFADNLEHIVQFQSRSIDLSAYANQTIYIAFRHHGTTNVYGMLIDGVMLPGTVICNPEAVSELNKVKSTIFPNPTTDNLNITSSLQGAATIRVFDAIGRVVLGNNASLSNATFTQNVSSLESGMYTIQIKTADKVVIEHFVKQ